MAFWNVDRAEMKEFRPGIFSKAEMGQNLILVCMEIGAGKEDPGHIHPFDQCGMVIEGEIEMFVGDDRKRLGPREAYFLPANVRHGWRTFDRPVRVLDVSARR